MLRNTIIVTSLISAFIIAAGCEEMDTDDPQIGTDSQALWSYPDQGEIAYGEVLKADLTGGDFGHVYSFEGIADQTVTFVLEWHEPESTGLGADIVVKDSGYNTIGSTYSWYDKKTHLDVTFPADGIYRVYVGHNFWGWFGRYPYQIGAEPLLCAQVSFVNTLPEWEGYEYYATMNFEPGEEGDAWDWFPNIGDKFAEMVELVERDVKIGACMHHIDGTCGSDDPQVCGGTIVGGGLFDNECAFRTEVNLEAGDFSSGIGGFTADLSVCEE